jgi:hypothetical protein
MNYLKVGHELPSEVAHGTHGHFDSATAARQIDADLFVLATLEKPCEADLGNNIISMVGSAGDDTREFT